MHAAGRTFLPREDSGGNRPEHAWHSQSIEDVSRDLGADPEKGLSSEEVARRLAQHGSNLLPERGATSPWKLFADQFRSLVIGVLVGAAIVSGLLGEWGDAIAILAIVLLNGVLGFVQEHRAERALRALRKLATPSSRVLRDGVLREVPAQDLVPGDVVHVEAGDHVPADARLVRSHGLRTQEAARTGESVPVEKTSAPVGSSGEVVAVGDRRSMIFLGTSAVAGRGVSMIVATGPDTELGKVAGLLERAGERETPLQRRLDRFASWLVYACLVIVSVVFVLGLVRGVPLLEMFLTAVSLAVAAVPEGLPAVVTIALALGVQRMVRRHVLIRKLPSVETLGCTSVICSDKTGTLTQNEMTVRALVVGNREIRVTGDGYAPRGEFHSSEGRLEPTSDAELLLALRIGALCNGASLAPGGGIVGDPTEVALLVAAAKAGLARESLAREMPLVAEIPFDADRKRMTTIHRDARGVVAFVKGAPEALLPRCTAHVDGGHERPFLLADRARLEAASARLAGDALRVLALAYRKLAEAPPDPTPEAIEHDLVLVGLVAMKDPARPEAREAVETCRRAGIRVVMITGDHRDTAVAIARDLGFHGPEDRALTGDDLERTSDADLEREVNGLSVYARVSPEHKLRIVRAWRKRGAVVAMTGDGVNDAPAVKEADIGVAMGRTGTDVTKEAADMVITDDNFASIVAAVEEGRGIFDNIRKFIFYLLSCNAGEIFTMLLAALLGWPLPLLPIHILWINLVTDGLPALALGVDPVQPGLMERPPRRNDEGVFTRRFLSDVLGVGALIAILSLAAFALPLHLEDHDVGRARTAAFTVLAVAQLFHAFNCRSDRESIFQLGLVSNWKLVIAFGVSLSLQIGVVTIPFIQPLFETVSLSLVDWVLVVGLASAPLWVVEAAKAWRRRSTHVASMGNAGR